MANLFEKQAWTNAVADLKAKAAEFMTLLNQVNATGPDVMDSPELRAERAKLIDRAGIIKSTIEKTTAGIDYVYGMWDKIFGNSQPVSGLGVLGFIPLVPVAVIAGAVGAVTYWITDAMKFLKRVNEVKALKAEGVSTRQAYAIVDKEGGIIGLIKTVAPWLAVGGIAWFITKAGRL